MPTDSGSQTNNPLLPKVVIYCDGSSLPNPGNAGWSAILIAQGTGGREIVRELTGGAAGSYSNNHAEISAAILGLSALKRPCRVEIVSDSQYLVNTMERGWQRNKNIELWQELDRLCAIHTCAFTWQRGHVGDKWNERSHTLAEQAMREAKNNERR